MGKAIVLMSLMLAAPLGAHAGELQGFVAGGGATSSRDGDTAVLSTGRLGYRVDDKFGFHAFGIAGYAGPERRVLVAGGAGFQLWTQYGKVRPYVRGGVLLQRELPLDDALDHPLPAVVGPEQEAVIRLGAVGAMGLDLPIWRMQGAELFVSCEASATGFRDDHGPAWYWAGTVGVGVNLDIARSEIR